MTTETLENKHFKIFFDTEKKEITCSDKDDIYNYPCFYSKKKRPVKKTWENVRAKMSDEMTFNQVASLVAETCEIHRWCSMD